MFIFLFFLLIRTFVIPWGTAIFLISSSEISDQFIMAGVALVYTVLTVPMIMWQLVKFVPTLLLTTFNRSTRIVIQVIIEVISIASLWFGVYWVLNR